MIFVSKAFRSCVIIVTRLEVRRDQVLIHVFIKTNVFCPRQGYFRYCERFIENNSIDSVLYLKYNFFIFFFFRKKCLYIVFCLLGFCVGFLQEQRQVVLNNKLTEKREEGRDNFLISFNFNSLLISCSTFRTNFS